METRPPRKNTSQSAGSDITTLVLILILVSAMLSMPVSGCNPAGAQLDEAKDAFAKPGQDDVASSLFLAVSLNWPGTPEAKEAMDYLACLSARDGDQSVSDWRDYLKDHPTGVCKDRAEQWLENTEAALCTSARNSSSPQLLGRYLAAFPKGKCAGEARDLVGCDEARKKGGSAWENYLTAFPAGKCVKEAEAARLEFATASVKASEDLPRLAREAQQMGRECSSANKKAKAIEKKWFSRILAGSRRASLRFAKEQRPHNARISDIKERLGDLWERYSVSSWPEPQRQEAKRAIRDGEAMCED